MTSSVKMVIMKQIKNYMGVGIHLVSLLFLFIWVFKINGIKIMYWQLASKMLIPTYIIETIVVYVLNYASIHTP